MRELLVAAIVNQLPQLDEFDEQFAAMIALASHELESSAAGDWNRLQMDTLTLNREKTNLLESIKQLGPRAMLQQVLDAIEKREQELLLRRHHLERRRRSDLVLPDSPSVIRSMLEEEFGHLATKSPEFSELMRKLVPQIYVYAVRLCDGGHLYPRAKVILNLAGTYPDINLLSGYSDALTAELTLDLFDPPQRERIREDAVRLATQGMKPKAISRAISERPTTTAVQNALELQRKMMSLGLDDPFLVMLEPPKDYPKLRRHKHARYSFEPLPGYERPPL